MAPGGSGVGAVRRAPRVPGAAFAVRPGAAVTDGPVGGRRFALRPRAHGPGRPPSHGAAGRSVTGTAGLWAPRST